MTQTIVSATRRATASSDVAKAIEKPDWRQSELGQIAARIFEIAPDLARIEKIEDVGLEHIALVAYALDVMVEFRVVPIASAEPKANARSADTRSRPRRRRVAETIEDANNQAGSEASSPLPA